MTKREKRRKDIPTHKVTDEFPWMSDEQFPAFLEDVRKHGQRDAITTWQGLILDGRGRWEACLELGLKPRCEPIEFGSDVEARAWLMSRNLRRTHAKAEQRAAAFILAMEKDPAWLALVAQKKKEADERRTGGKKAAGKSVDVWISGDLGVSKSTYQRVNRVRTTMGRSFCQLVLSGQKTCGQLFKTDTETNRASQPLYQAMKVEKEGFDVVLADPPWSYGSGSSESSINDTSPEGQYCTLSEDEIKWMNVGQYCKPDAVLFLWAVSSKLPLALEVINEWGFKYCTSWIWAKTASERVRSPGQSMGGWVRMRHELLLIATRGKSVPRIKLKTLPDSVANEPVTEHSRKPEYFRETIEKMYPGKKRLDLFSREKRKGWKTFGDQVAL